MSTSGEPLPGDPRGEVDLFHDVARCNLRRRLFGSTDRTRLGRYEIVSIVGLGGMGVVYRARDPDLARDVAIKVIRGGGGRSGAARLAREAKALATLEHENILPIYDVGIAAAADAHRLGIADLFVVTELVEGRSAAAWLEHDTPAWPEIRRVFAAAAQGLAAAHAAGFVHRDFKPGNVLVGDDGRVRVCDFGLVATADDPASTTDPSPRPTRARDVKLSRTDGCIGTPGYIAPECFHGEQAGPRSDQYAFCVALWEAVYGQHPFLEHRGSLDASGRVLRTKPRRREIPRALHAALERGLAHDPRERWPSMQPLIELLHERKRRRRGLIAASIAVLAVLPVAALIGPDDRCSVEEQLAEVWNAERNATVAAAILATGAPYGPEGAERVTAHLDAFAQAWARGYADACGAMHRASTPTDDARLRCYQRQLVDLDATVTTLSEVTSGTLAASVSAALDLDSPASCETADDAKPSRAPEEEALAAIAAREIARSAALRRAHRFDEALEAARRAVAIVEPLPSMPEALEASIAVGRALAAPGRHDEAAVELEAAYFAASSVADDARALDAAAARLDVARAARDLDAGRRWAQHARTLLRGPAVQPAEIEILRSEGHLETLVGDFDEGVQLLERAHTLAMESTDEHSAAAVDSAAVLADAYRSVGRNEEALELQRSVLDSRIARLGASHPAVGDAHAEIGGTYARQGRLDEAEVELQHALAIETSVGETLALAAILAKLAYVDTERGEHDRARGSYERALAIRLRLLGPEHPHVASTRLNLGTLASEQGRLDEAEAYLGAAIETALAKFGPDDTFVAAGHYNLAFVHFKRGEVDRAVASWREAARAWEASRGGDTRELADAYRMLALHHPDDAQARAFADRAIAIAEAIEDNQHARALAYAAMASVLRRQDAPTDADVFAARARETCPTARCRSMID